MIRSEFRTGSGGISGFTVSGHSGSAVRGSDIICAAVSSAAYMTVNTLTDVLHTEAEVELQDGYLRCDIPGNGDDNARALLEGFRLHMEQLQEQYPHYIKISTEVSKNA